MKNKISILILALTVVSWAQTSTQSTPADPQQNTSPAATAKCACCDKMASPDSKDAKMCARHGKHAKGSCCAGNAEMSCCGGKDGKSCMKDDKAAGSCCKDCDKDKDKDKSTSNCCGKDCKAGCCSKKTEAAMSCCHHANHS